MPKNYFVLVQIPSPSEFWSVWTNRPLANCDQIHFTVFLFCAQQCVRIDSLLEKILSLLSFALQAGQLAWEPADVPAGSPAGSGHLATRLSTHLPSSILQTFCCLFWALLCVSIPGDNAGDSFKPLCCRVLWLFLLLLLFFSLQQLSCVCQCTTVWSMGPACLIFKWSRSNVVGVAEW